MKTRRLVLIIADVVLLAVCISQWVIGNHDTTKYFDLKDTPDMIVIDTPEEKGITIVVAEQKIMLLCEFVKKLIVLEKGTCVHYGEIRSTLIHQKEMEEAGINCPRVLTLTGRMVEEGLVPASYTQEDRICLNAQEAANFIKGVANV